MPSGSSKTSSLRRRIIGLGVLALTLLLGLALANAVDYFRFQRAVARIEKLTEPQLLALADYCRDVKQLTHFRKVDAPAAFAPLKPVSGSLFPGLADALLYEVGEIYLWARISTSASNQQVSYFTNSTGPQKDKVLWNRNPEFVKRVSPAGRLVTVTQWSMSKSRRWIVQNDHLYIIDRSGRSGQEDVIRAMVSIDTQARDQINAAIGSIEPTSRGKDYRMSEVADGISLDISFTPTGEAGPDDIAISNTKVDAVHPLLEAISKFAPKEYPIEFERIVSGDELSKDFHVTVRTLRERAALDWPTPKTPWWCLWRAFVY